MKYCHFTSFVVNLFVLLISIENADGEMVDLNKFQQNFVLEEKRLVIPGYPEAFNPSIARWNGRLLLSFRALTNPNNLWHGTVGLVWLDEDFNIDGKPQLLDMRENWPIIPSRAEDARILTVADKLYVIYNDNITEKDEGERRMYSAEIVFKEGRFSILNPEGYKKFEGEDKNRMEKNWVPFDYANKLLLAYSLVPHKIFAPIGKGICRTIANSHSEIEWHFGHLRGGTPALQIDEYQYLAFFHSSRHLVSTASQGISIWHYVMGAYTFSSMPPFQILLTSPDPIVGKTFYDDQIVPKKVIFPGGYVFDKKYIWVAYGRNDTECWIVKIDRSGLLNSLQPVNNQD